ncbi:MAG: hypothetical protein A3F90_05015 [Deltaproteobacteria bacterium RIFCSPLOWO2_12_FULL_60_19]|nr:MAG: hypothetical protein A3F90_05015 [Deltaproteobacteria bacterium RIFCSPLOWO2_12_FULL_60_19]
MFLWIAASIRLKPSLSSAIAAHAHRLGFGIGATMARLNDLTACGSTHARFFLPDFSLTCPATWCYTLLCLEPKFLLVFSQTTTDFPGNQFQRICDTEGDKFCRA